jgi:hypothetical protein
MAVFKWDFTFIFHLFEAEREKVTRKVFKVLFVGLVIAPSYIFLTFFKMIFLVIVLGFLHGLFLLPVLLSLFGPGSCSKQVKNHEINQRLEDRRPSS